MVMRVGWFRIQHEINALNLNIICDTLTLVATFRVCGSKLWVLVPSIRVGARENIRIKDAPY
jgi:hypothetical protein